jgi:hypothetical protein
MTKSKNVQDLDFDNLHEILGITKDDIEMLKETPDAPMNKCQPAPIYNPNNDEDLNEMGSLTKVENVYQEFTDLIKTGKTVLASAAEAVRYNPDGENLAGLSSLINTVKDTLKEFSKVHLLQVKYNQQIAIEELKAKKKLEFLKAKSLLEKENNKDDTPTNLIKFNQEEIIDAIVESETKFLQ